MIRTTVGEARKEWGDDLVVASLAAVAKDLEKDGWRIVYDATHGVRLNHRIRIRDQVRMPAWQDVSRILEAVRDEEASIRFCLKYDVSKAHRRIQVARSE